MHVTDLMVTGVDPEVVANLIASLHLAAIPWAGEVVRRGLGYVAKWAEMRSFESTW